MEVLIGCLKIDNFRRKNKMKETKAKLNNNKIVIYHACSKKRHQDDYQHFNYLGRGVIYSIGGVKQKNKQLYYFFCYK